MSVEHSVPIATRDLLRAQIFEQRLAMDEAKASTAKCGDLVLRRVCATPRINRSCSDFPMTIQKRLFEHASCDQRLRRRTFASEAGDARFRLFHEESASESLLRAHVTPSPIHLCFYFEAPSPFTV